MGEIVSKIPKTGVKLPNGKCMIGDEPITVKLKVLPAEGSVMEHVTGEFKGETIKSPDRTGDCPECEAHVPLSAKGFVTAHVVKGGTIEPSSMLTEPQVDPTDTGSRIGDPRSAMQRRTVEIDGAFEHGTVQVPVMGKNGRTKLEDVSATEENVRAALEYWRTRKPRSESARTAQNEHVSVLTRRLEAMRKGVPALTALESPEGRTTQMSPGPPLVKGRGEAPMAGTVAVRQAGEEYVRPADPEDNRGHGTTWTAPTGRERMDKESSTVPIVGGRYGYLTQEQFDRMGCDHKPLGIGMVCDSSDCARKFRTRSNKYWARIRKQEAYAKAHQGTQTRIPVRLGTGGMGSSSFADGDARETERVMRQPKS